MVSNNDDANSAEVDRLIDKFIFLPDITRIFVMSYQDYHAISGLYST